MKKHDKIDENDIPFLVETGAEDAPAIDREELLRKEAENPDENGDFQTNNETSATQQPPKRKKRKKKADEDSLITEEDHSVSTLRALIKGWRQFFGGPWFRRNVLYFIFLIVCLCFYIYARYQYQDLLVENQKLRNQLIDRNKHAVLSAAELTQFTRRSNIEQHKQDSTLRTSENPPIVIEADE